MAEEKKLQVDVEGFNKAMEAARERSRTAQNKVSCLLQCLFYVPKFLLRFKTPNEIKGKQNPLKILILISSYFLSLSHLSFVIVSKLVVLLSWMLMLHQRCTKEALLQQMIVSNLFGSRYEFFVGIFSLRKFNS
jgi:hypothetical protein